jgi:thymidylate synthase
MKIRTTTVDVVHEFNSFPNAWARAVKMVMKHGKEKEIKFGGKIPEKDQYEVKIAREMYLTVVMEGNAIKDIINLVRHPQFPTKENVLMGYLKEWERGYDWVKQGFTYCYEDRIESYPSTMMYDIDEGSKLKRVDQWKLAREDLRNQISDGIQSNRNSIVIGIPYVDRYEIPDSPPCLREINIRWEGDNKVSVVTYWRSRDLYSAWMSNIFGLISAVQREVVIPNGCEIIQYVDTARSLHIYKGDWESAEKVNLVQVNPQMIR